VIGGRSFGTRHISSSARTAVDNPNQQEFFQPAGIKLSIAEDPPDWNTWFLRHQINPPIAGQSVAPEVAPSGTHRLAIVERCNPIRMKPIWTRRQSHADQRTNATPASTPSSGWEHWRDECSANKAVRRAARASSSGTKPGQSGPLSPQLNYTSSGQAAPRRRPWDSNYRSRTITPGSSLEESRHE